MIEDPHRLENMIFHYKIYSSLELLQIGQFIMWTYDYRKLSNPSKN